MTGWKVLTAAALATLVLAGCGDDDDDNFRIASQAALRVIHASPDAPDVNVLVNGGAALEGVAYKEGSAFLDLDPGTYDLAVEAITPAGNVVVLDLQDTPLDGDTDYSALAIGKVADATLQALVLENPSGSIASGKLRARVVHAAPEAPEVDVYVTAPGVPLAEATALATLAFGDDAGPVEVDGGDYQIRITTAGPGAVLVFDSGTVALDAGTDLLIAAVANTATGPSSVSLLVNTGSTQFEILDAATTADIRVGHLSPDTDAVDVVVNDDFGSPVVTGLTFPTVTGYLQVPPGDYNVKVVDTATQATTAINLDAALVAGIRYTALAVNTFANIEPLVLTDDIRSIATEARVRLVHASPAAGLVDIYVTAPGADISALQPSFADVPFKAETGFVSLPAGTYDVSITPANDPLTVAIYLPDVALAAGDVITAVARDTAGGGGPLDVVVIDEID